MGRANISGAVTASYGRKGDAARARELGGCSMGGGARRAKYRQRWELEQFGPPAGV